MIWQMAATTQWIAVCLLLLLFHSCYGAGNIHRAMNPTTRNKGKTAVITGDTMVSEQPELTSSYTPWFYAIPATLLVGLTGIFPLLVIPVEAGHKLREGVSADRLKLLLSFAVGGLLGDVFLHLLPEAYGPVNGVQAHDQHLRIGLWIIAGLLTFLVLEKIFQEDNGNDEDTCKEKSDKDLQKMETVNHKESSHSCNGHTADKIAQNGVHDKNGYVKENGQARNGFTQDVRKRTTAAEVAPETENKHNDSVLHEHSCDTSDDNVKVVGYLNLLANCIDNFTHGLAVSGSFLVSTKVGMLTTFAILLHEIPHEVGDFAILLKSGFRRWDAACGQILTATGGLFGAVFGLICSEAGDNTYWVLPFTSGGFIYIALVTIVPELLEEKRPWESIKQVITMVSGITAMGMVSLIHYD